MNYSAPITDLMIHNLVVQNNNNRDRRMNHSVSKTTLKRDNTEI